jgi:importin subunit beta-1
MTDLIPILTQSLSNNNKIRNNAERKLTQAKKSNLILYFTTLVLILANERYPKQSRQMAGILLKNELSVKDEEIQKELTQKWLKLENNLRNKIKTQVGNVLRSNSYEIRKIASIMLSKIKSIDLYNNMSTNFIKMLKVNITRSIINGGVQN